MFFIRFHYYLYTLSFLVKVIQLPDYYLAVRKSNTRLANQVPLRTYKDASAARLT